MDFVLVVFVQLGSERNVQLDSTILISGDNMNFTGCEDTCEKVTENLNDGNK